MIYAIDPGTFESALVIYNDEGCGIDGDILGNEWIEEELNKLHSEDDHLVIEMVASYGMPVGKDIFETVYWIGRFASMWDATATNSAERIYRRDIKMHLCGSARAKDANVRQALIDRFGPSKEKAIGKKKTPGPLYGFKSHMWAALAVAVTYADRSEHGVDVVLV